MTRRLRAPGSVLLRRRTFLKGASAVGLAMAAPAIITRRGHAQDVPTVVNSIRSLANPYHATWEKGGEAFANSVGAEVVTLVTEGNSEKVIADIKAILAQAVAPASSTSIRTTARTRGPSSRPARRRAPPSSPRNKPADLYPWDHDPNYVSHISFSGVPYGKAMAPP